MSCCGRSLASDCISAKNALPRARHLSQEACRKSAFVAAAPNTGFPAHIAQRFTPIGACQLVRVICEASEFEAKFTLCEEANDERLSGTVRRAAKKLSQGLKLSQRELR
jgi:hypothetical protein